jgi:DNA-directed RNA polymerase subunit beta
MSVVSMVKVEKKLEVKKSFGASSSLSKRKFWKSISMVSLPNLIELQLNSYNWFLEKGLKEILGEVNPIKDFTEKDLELSFGECYLDDPKYDEVTAKNKNISYEAPLRCKVKLLVKNTGEIKEQEIYLGDFPLMTDRGTFIINGVERVVVSQIIRSPGVFFTMNYLKGKKLFGAKVIPNRGAWLELETDLDGAIFVKIDRKRKVAVTSLLRAFGYSTDQEILNIFKDTDNGEIRYIEKTIEKDIAKSRGEGYKEVYKRIRPGDLATESNAKQVIDSMFFNFEKYDFGGVGRYRLNQRLEIEFPDDEKHRVLTLEDFNLIIKEIIRLNNDPRSIADDIDHLGNRRVRSVGELIQNKLRIGLARMARNIKDRMSTCDIAVVVPGQLINSRPVAAAIKEFFSSSQLSQFMDQVNPLAELEHKRRISAMGPGGLTRERAGFEVRDVHPSHYGRICPVETPEGPNIGLVGHLASYAKINDYGFLETPYLKVYKEIENGNEEKLIGKILAEKIGNFSAGTKIDEEIAKKIVKIKERKKIAIKPWVSREIEYVNATKEDKKISLTPE